jgi:hypothetical protein
MDTGDGDRTKDDARDQPVSGFEQLQLDNQRTMIGLLMSMGDALTAALTKTNGCAATGESADSATGHRNASDTQYDVPATVMKPPARRRKAMTFSQVAEAIKGEREYQLRRWGNRISVRGGGFTMHETQHSVGSFISFIDHYLSLAKGALATKTGTADALDMMRKVAALCFALGEMHGFPHRPACTVVNGHDGLPA